MIESSNGDAAVTAVRPPAVTSAGLRAVARFAREDARDLVVRALRLRVASEATLCRNAVLVADSQNLLIELQRSVVVYVEALRRLGESDEMAVALADALAQQTATDVDSVLRLEPGAGAALCDDVHRWARDRCASHVPVRPITFPAVQSA